MALGLSIPTMAFSLPLLTPFFGRKRRNTPSGASGPLTDLNWTLPMETDQKTHRRDIATSQCRRLDAAGVADAVLLCPGQTLRTFNMIRIFAST